MKPLATFTRRPRNQRNRACAGGEEVSEYTPTYDKSRYPKQPGKGLCRGCGKQVPPRRQSWCSKVCIDRFHPWHVLRAVKGRDKGICQMCGMDTKDLYKRWHALKPDWLDKTAYEAWRKLKPAPEYDHIIPFSEGGLTVIENMRTLCGPCHKSRTADWRRAKAA